MNLVIEREDTYNGSEQSRAEQSRAEQSRAEQSRAEQSRADYSYNFVDILKFVMALLVVGLHAHPLFDYSAEWDYYFSGGITRLAVPYFFMASGFFLFRKMPPYCMDGGKIKKYCKRIFGLYLAWVAVYLPMALYEVYKNPEHMRKCLSLVKNFLLNGSVVYHLWYLYASVAAVLTIYFLWKHGASMKKILALGAILYLIPIIAYGYHGVYLYFFPEGCMANTILGYFGKLFGSYNGWTVGMLYIAAGGLVAWKESEISQRYILPAAGLAVLGYCAETWFVHTFKLVDTDSNAASFLLFPAVLSLFLLSCKIKLRNRGIYKHLREQSLFIYLVHPWFLFLGNGFAKKVLKLEDYHILVFCVVVVLSILSAEILRRLCRHKQFAWLG